MCNGIQYNSNTTYSNGRFHDKSVNSSSIMLFNPIALKTGKTLWSFGHSE